MFQVGMKVLIIGATTAEGQQWIGSEAQVHQLLNEGDIIDPGLVILPEKFGFLQGEVKIRWLQQQPCAIVYKEGLSSVSRSLRQNFAIFKLTHLMPIPGLEDPGIDECTFTPIIQKENA